MNSFPALRRLVAAGTTAIILAGVLVTLAWSNRKANDTKADEEKNASSHGWTLWGGSLQRNMVNTTERDMPTEWSVEEGSQKNIKWSAALGSKAYGGPVVGDGKVFIGTNNDKPRDPKITDDKGIVMCFRESDGKFLWQAVHDKLTAGLVNDWPREGVCSTPVVEGKRIYYVSNRCEVECATTEGLRDGMNVGVKDEKYKGPGNADFVWRFNMMRELNVFPHNLSASSPLIVGDHLYVVTSNGVDEGHKNIPSPQAPSFLCLNKKTGKVVWTSNAPGNHIMHGQWSSPVYAEVNGKGQIIFPGGDGYMRGFEADTGKVLWKFFCDPIHSVYLLGGKGTRSDFLATPVVYHDKLYIGVGQDPEHEEGVGHFWCIDLQKATRFGATNKDNDVSPVNDNFDPKAEVNQHSALGWHYGGAAKDPEKLGRNYYFGRTLSTACIHDGLVYIADLSGWLHCLDAETGEQYWEHETGAACWSSAYYVDGKVYLGNDDGKMTIFEAGKNKKVLNEIDMGATIRATPVAADGILYVMTENRLYAIKK
ncbi:MAG TPA: PQQ-binding-like beta-propeller repeat protein [Gemmataceae bacterium]|nr:PQQ-binding-like beta-propeller repeat protein [Gemmataceae bacterium]